MSGAKRAADRILEQLSKEGGVGQEARPSHNKALSTGSTLLNLACTGNPFGGFAPGRYYFLVGDAASGKTFLSMTCFAEATIDKRFDNHRLVYDNAEDGCLLDLESLFNEEVAKRVEPPAKDEEGSSVYSTSIEDFYDNLDTAIEDGRPFIYILDSMDVLTSQAEGEKFEQHKEARKRGTRAPGSYGDGKAKVNSTNLRRALAGIRKTNSILIILSQTRDNLGFGFEKKTRSGGHALRFYATIEIWSSIVGKITKTIQGKARPIGVYIRLKVKKNRVTGLTPEVTISIYPSHGIDDLGSCVDYLLDEGWWEGKGKRIDKGPLDGLDKPLSGSRDKVIAYIEENGLVRTLRRTVGLCWNAIELQSRLQRKNRYRRKE